MIRWFASNQLDQAFILDPVSNIISRVTRYIARGLRVSRSACLMSPTKGGSLREAFAGTGVYDHKANGFPNLCVE